MTVIRASMLLFVLSLGAALSAQALTGVSPSRGDPDAPRNANAVATFNTPMQAPAGTAFQVTGSQTGFRSGSISGGGTSTLTFNPAADFRANERVAVTLTAGVQSTGSVALTNPTTWEFVAASVPGPTDFSQFRQSLGNLGSGDVEAADLNGNGHLDLVFTRTNNAPRVYWNDGSGGFSTTNYTTLGSPATSHYVRIGDLNGNGRLDVVFTVSDAPPWIAFNNGGGNFTVTPIGGSTIHHGNPDLGDIDNDGDLDIVAPLWNAPNAMFVYRNNGNGTFAAPQGYGTGNRSDAVLGDLNNDGYLDAATDREWFYNDGTGALTTSAPFPLGNSAGAPAIADLNSDGFVDMVTTSVSTGETRIFLNNTTGGFTAGQVMAGGNNGIALGDVNGDGHLDLMRVGNAAFGIQIWGNNGAGVFSMLHTASSGGASANTASLLVDLDSDHDLDMVVSRSSNFSEVLLNRLLDPDVALSAGTLAAPTNIDSIAGALSFTNVFEFKLTDGGSAVGHGFSVAGVSVNVSGMADAALHTWKLVVPGFGDFPGSVTGTPGTQKVTFSLSGVSAGSAGSVNLLMAVQLAPTPTEPQDNKTLSFLVQAADIQLGGSQFAPSQSPVASASPLTYRAVATALAVSTQPPASIETNAPFPVEARYVDANGNLDLDVQGDLLSATRSDAGAVVQGTSAPAVNGVTAFSGASAVVLGLPAAAAIHLILTDNTGGSINLSATPVNTAQLNLLAQAILSVSPPRHAPGASRSSNVSATFPMNMGAPGAGNFRVSGAFSGRRSGAYSGASTATLQFDPGADFLPGEIVTVSLTTALLDALNNPLAHPEVWRFRAGATPSAGVFNAVGTWGVTNRQGKYVAPIDLNGDGHLDLVCGANDGLYLFTNTGTGDLVAAGTLLAGHDIVAGAHDDIDLDGQADLVLRTSAGALLIMRRDSTGALYLAEQLSGVSTRPLLADLDGDGFADLIAGNTWWKNSGSGSFAWTGAATTLPLPSTTTTGAVGDVDANGALDLLLWSGGFGHVFLNDRHGGLTLHQSFPGTATLTEAGDFNGNGQVDFVARNGSGLYWVRNDNGQMTPQATLAGSAGYDGLALADLDGDGDLDVAMYGPLGTSRNRLFFNNGAGGIAQTQDFGLPAEIPACIAWADLNGDGCIDLVTGENGTVFIHFNATATAPMLVQHTPPSGSAAVAQRQSVRVEFNRLMNPVGTSTTIRAMSNMRHGVVLSATQDPAGFTLSRLSSLMANERIDVVVSSALQDQNGTPLTNPRVIQLRVSSVGPGDVNFAAPVNFGSGTDATRAIAAGDVNGDGFIDLVVANYGGPNQVWHGNGTGGFTAGPTVGTGTDNTQCVLLADINRDNRLDIVLGNNGQNVVLLNAATSPWTTALNFGTGSDNTAAVAVGDINLDGWIDLVTGENGGQNRVYLNNGGGLQSGANFGSGSDFTRAVALADLNGDGQLDLVAGNQGSANQYYLNSGGTFGSAQTLTSSHLNTQAIAVADLNGDNLADIVVANDGQNEVFLNAGSGTFAAPANLGPATGDTRALELGDFDGNGTLDVVAANDGSQPVVWLNSGSGTFGTGKLFGTTAAGAAIVAADFTGDRVLEVALGVNLGQNRVFRNDYLPVVNADATIAPAALTEPTSLDSVVATNTATPVLDFALVDGGASDGLPTVVTALEVNVTGIADDATWTLNGPGVSNVEGLASGGVVRFENLAISVADGTSQVFTVSMRLHPTLATLDGQGWALQVSVANIERSPYGTQFVASGSVSNGSGVALDVAATELRMVSQPPTQAVVAFPIAMVVAYTDAFGRIDRDVTDTLTVSRSDSGPVLSSTTLAAANGIAVYSGQTAVRLGNPAATGISLVLTDDATGVSVPAGFTHAFDLQPAFEWTGVVSSDWNTPGNWSTNAVPGTLDSVLIASGAPNVATLTQGVAVRDLLILTGATVDVASYSLEIRRSATFEGGIAPSTGLIRLNGASVWAAGSATLHNVRVLGAVEMLSDLRFTGDLSSGLNSSLNGAGLTVHAVGTAAQDIAAEIHAHLRISNTSAPVTLSMPGSTFTVANKLQIDAGATLRTAEEFILVPDGPNSPLLNAGELQVGAATSHLLRAGGVNLGNVRVVSGTTVRLEQLGPANTGALVIESGATASLLGTIDFSGTQLTNNGWVSISISGSTPCVVTPPAGSFGNLRVSRPAPGTTTFTAGFACQDLELLGVSQVTFTGAVTASGNVTLASANAPLPRLILSGTSQSVTGSGGSAVELVVSPGSQVALSGNVGFTSILTGASRAITVEAGGTLSLVPSSVITLGTPAAGAEMLVAGTLSTSVTGAQVPPRIRAASAGSGFRLALTGTLNIDGLALENLGGPSMAWGMEWTSGSVTKFDGVQVTAGASTTAAIRAVAAALPATINALRLDGTAPANIDGSGYAGSTVTIFPHPTGEGNLYGAALEIDPGSKFDWTMPFQLAGTTPPANSHAAATNTTVTTTFSAAAASPPAGAFVVEGSNTGRVGGQLNGGLTTTLSFVPARSLHPNEVVEVRLTTAIQSASSAPLPRPYIVRFRGAASGGNGVFGNPELLVQSPQAPSIAIAADMNRDGHLDLILGVPSISSNSQSVRVFLNDGAGRFELLQTISTPGTQGFAVVDMNQDGWPDLALTLLNSLRIYLNNGAGWLDSGSPASYPVAGTPGHINVGDFNGDGMPDLVLSYDATSNEAAYVLLNNGTGGIVQPYTTLPNHTANYITVGDVNGDGSLDLVRGRMLLLNDGAGNFSSSFWTGTDYAACELGDFNGDGSLDILALRLSGQDVVFLNNGSGNFTAGSNVGPSNSSYRGARLGDVNGDGHLDAVLYGSSNALLLINAGNASFATSPLSAVSNVRAVPLVDLDGDGDLDLVIRDNSSETRVFYNDTRAATPPLLVAATPAPQSTAVRGTSVQAQFDGAVGVPGAGSVLVSGSHSGRRAGSITTPTPDTVQFTPTGEFKPGERVTVTIPPGLGPTPTLRASSWEFVARSNPAVFLQVDATASVLPGSDALNARCTAVGDFNGDGYIDIAIGVSGAANRVYLNNGSGQFTAGPTFGTAGDTRALVAVDLNYDGALDMVEAVYGGLNRIYLNSTGTFVLHGTFDATTGQSTSIATGDVNRDGHIDILVGNFGGQNRLYLNDGSLGFTSFIDIGSGTDNTTCVAIGDFIADGRPDLFTGNDTGNSHVYAQDALGGINLVWSPVLTGVSACAVGDLNSDGFVDLLPVTLTGFSLTWLEGGPSQVTWSTNSFYGGISSVAITEVRGTTAPEIVVGRHGVNEVVQSNGGSLNLMLGSATTVGVAAADFDGDGRVDILSVNQLGQDSTVHFLRESVPVLQSSLPSDHAMIDGVSHLTATFNFGMTAPTAATYPVFSNLRGRISGTYSLSANSMTLRFLPSQPLLPGEVLTMVASSALTRAGGTPVAWPGVWTLYAESGPGAAGFTSSGQAGGNASVCVAGDFDGDGQVDLCVGGGTAIDTRVYWNSNGAFSNSTIISTGRDTRSLAAGDLNGDGRLDIIEGNYGQHSNVYLNSASGFGAAIPFGGATEPTAAVAVSDLDGDGNLDVLCGSDGGQDRIWHGNGQGAFPASTTLGGSTTNTRAVAVATWAIAGIWQPVVLIGDNGGQNRGWVRGGLGYASFNFGTGSDATIALAVADLNHDGMPDVVIGNSGAQPSVSFGGAGTFGSPVSIGAAKSTHSVLIGDLDGDGNHDIVLVRGAGDASEVLLSNGAGQFGTPLALATSLDSRGAAHGDLDGDGDLDLFFTHTGGGEIWANGGVTPSVIATTPPAHTAGAGPWAATFNTPLAAGAESYLRVSSSVGVPGNASLAGDTITFTPTATRAGETYRMLLLPGLQSASGAALAQPFTVRFRAPTATSPAQFASFADAAGTDTWRAAIAADINGDGLLDIVASRGTSLVVLTQSAGMQFTAGSAFGTGTLLDELMAADVNNDGRVDVIANNGGNGAALLTQQTNGSFQETQLIASGRVLGMEDLDGDGFRDVVFATTAGAASLLWNNAGTFASGGLLTGSAIYGSRVCFGDVNGDGLTDVSWGSRVIRNLGNRGFAVHQSIATDILLWADLDNNGSLDAVSTLRLYSNQGGTLVSGALHGFDGELQCCGDINGDGALDVLYRTTQGAYVWHLNNGAMVFSALPALSDVQSFDGVAGAFDINGDGRLDVLATSSTGPVRIVTQGGAPVVAGVAPAHEQLAPANSQPRLTFSEPADTTSLAQDGIVVSTGMRGRLSGAPGFLAGGTQLQFAPAQGLRAGETVQVTLRGGLEGTQSSGTMAPYTWRFRVGGLPATASFPQESALYAASSDSRHAAVGDFDGDGDLDLLVSSHLEQDYIYWNAGNGTFSLRAAFGAPGSLAAHLVTADIDLDGDVDVVLSRSGTSVEVYRNQGGGTFALTVHAQSGTHPVLADLNGDAYPDLITATGWSAGGAAGFSVVQAWPGAIAASTWHAAAAGDVNNDGWLDVVLASSTLNRIQVLYSSPAGLVAGPIENETLSNLLHIEVADFDADGVADVLVCQQTQTPMVFRNTGAGNLSFLSSLTQAPSGGGGVIVGDFNGDSILDLLLGGNFTALYRGNGSGGFTLGHTFPAGLVSVTAGDLDNDGRLDVVGLRTTAADSVWLNTPPAGAVDANIALVGTQTTLLDSAAAAAAPVPVLAFRITDQNTADAAPVNISALHFAVGGFTAPGEHDWSLVVGASAPIAGAYSGGSVSFTGLGVQVAAGSTLDLTLYVRLSATPLNTLDGDVLHVALDAQGVVFGTGSTFTGGVSNAPGAAYSVVGTALSWTTRPGNGTTGTPLPVQPVVSITDAAGNVDRNATGTVSIDATTVSPGPALPVLGVRTATVSLGSAVYGSIQFDQSGSQLTLRAWYGTITSDSPPFEVASTGGAAQPPQFISLRVSDATNVYRAGDTISLTAQLTAAGLSVVADLTAVDTALSGAASFVDQGNGLYTLTTQALSSGTLVVGEYLPIPVTATNSAALSASRTVRVHTMEAQVTAQVSLNQPANAVGPGDLLINLLSSHDLGSTPRISVTGLPGSLNVNSQLMTGQAPGRAFGYTLSIPAGSAGTGTIVIEGANDVTGEPVSVNGIHQFTIVANAGLRAEAQSAGELAHPQRIALDGTGSVSGTTFAWTQEAGPVVTIQTPAAALASVDLLSPGRYVFRLQVSNGTAAADDLVTVLLKNSAPVVAAGTDQHFETTDVINVGGNDVTPLTLSASVFDANGDAVWHEWIQVGAPAGGNLRVLDPSDLHSRVEVLGAAIVPGVYTFALRAADTVMQAEDATNSATMRIVVVGAGVAPPASHAGFPVVGIVGAPVQLTGHESADSDATIPTQPNLDYFWTMERRPPGSTAAIQIDTARQPSFVPDVPGTYVVSLVVVDEDGLVSGRDMVSIVANRATPANSVPRAVPELQFVDANSNGSLNVGESATLSAANSVDGENDTITFLWRQVAGPAVVFLADPQAATHAVTFPVEGNYRFEVQVWDQTDIGIPAEISVAVAASGKVAPAAAAAIDAADDPNTDGYVLVIPGVGVDNNSGNPAINLSAAGTTIDTSLTATYRWALVRGPTVSLTGADTSSVSFVPQISRVYELELAVTDSNGVSSITRLAIAVDTWDATHNPAGNAVPRVTGAPDQVVAANTLVVLNGSATDPNDGSTALIYIWVQRIGPPVFLDTSTPTAPTFTAPIAGTYGFTLYVDDGHDISPGFDVVITAEPPTTGPNPKPDDGGGKGDSDSGCDAKGGSQAWILCFFLVALAGAARRRAVRWQGDTEPASASGR